MNLHPLIGGTVALWQLQSDFKDTSGNGIDLTPVNVITNAPAAAPTFAHLFNKSSGVVTNDPCLMGVDFATQSASKLMAPFTPLLLLTGALTIEWLFIQAYSNTHCYFACADPAGRSGGGAPDRIGSLYTLWTGNGRPVVSDEFIGSNLPSVGYGSFSGWSQATWCGFGSPGATDQHCRHMAMVRDASGNWTAYIDGVNLGASVLSAGTNVALGIEQMFLGEAEHNNNNALGVMASARVLNYARSAANILADANYALGVCGTQAVPPVTDGTSGTSTFSNMVYDGVAAAQFATSLRQAPRS